jgi:hypothetical protein
VNAQSGISTAKAASFDFVIFIVCLQLESDEPASGEAEDGFPNVGANPALPVRQDVRRRNAKSIFVESNSLWSCSLGRTLQPIAELEMGFS